MDYPFYEKRNVLLINTMTCKNADNYNTVDYCYYVDRLLRYICYYITNSKHQTIYYINPYKLFPL